MISTDLLVKVIRFTGGDPEKSAALIQECESIRERIEDRKRKVGQIRKDAESKINKLMEEIICDHKFVSTSYDPSGGSDRTHQCLVCNELIYAKMARFT